MPGAKRLAVHLRGRRYYRRLGPPTVVRVPRLVSRRVVLSSSHPSHDSPRIVVRRRSMIRHCPARVPWLVEERLGNRFRCPKAWPIDGTTTARVVHFVDRILFPLVQWRFASRLDTFAGRFLVVVVLVVVAWRLATRRGTRARGVRATAGNREIVSSPWRAFVVGPSGP